MRARLGLEAGDQLLVTVQNNDTIILKRRPAALVTELRGLLPRPKRALTAEEMDAALPPTSVPSNRPAASLDCAGYGFVGALAYQRYPCQAAKVEAWLKANASPKTPAYVDHVVLCKLGWVLEAQ